MTRRLALPLALAALLLAPAGASAKELVEAEVCGDDDCVTIADRSTLAGLVDGGAPSTPPRGPAAFYTIRLTAAAERERHSWSIAYVPSARKIRARDDGYESGFMWGTTSTAFDETLAKLTGKLEPFPAARLRGWQAKPPEATVHMVIPPPADPAPASGGGFPWTAAGLGLAAVALLGGGGWAARRRLRGVPRARPAS